MNLDKSLCSIPCKLNRRLVACEYELFSRLMEVIEYVEESILCLLFAGKLMNVINDQHIDHLVEMKEIILVVVPDRLNKLGLEFVCIYIKNSLVRDTFP
ncbi:MAG: hypothetical protein MZV63_11445 [Marinilabiliales bacterium]|nr:hypothetical protein [Marinilabiliales bacterium]